LLTPAAGSEAWALQDRVAGHDRVGQRNGVTGHGQVGLVLGPPSPEAAGSAQALAHPHPLEGVHEGAPEAGVHEAVGDRVAAAGGVGQQLQETDGRVVHVLVHRRPQEHGHRVDHVQRCPADEELQHQDEQHLDHPLLALQALAFVGPARHNWQFAYPPGWDFS